MSAVVGAVSAAKEVPCNPHLEEELKNKVGGEPSADGSHIVDAEEAEPEEEDNSKLEPEADRKLDLGPQVSIKEQLEKDKDDESLRKWKEHLLGSVDVSAVGDPESKDPEVKMVSLAIVCPGRPDTVLPIPFPTGSKKSLFTLKEGCKYRLRYTFNVSNNIVSGLKYINFVWKSGIRVDNSKRMFGTFSPKQESYVYETEEETCPSGFFVRGSYSVRTKFVDDDGKCYLDHSYYFDIQKNWPTSP